MICTCSTISIFILPAFSQLRFCTEVIRLYSVLQYTQTLFSLLYNSLFETDASLLKWNIGFLSLIHVDTVLSLRLSITCNVQDFVIKFTRLLDLYVCGHYIFTVASFPRVKPSDACNFHKHLRPFNKCINGFHGSRLSTAQHCMRKPIANEAWTVLAVSENQCIGNVEDPFSNM